LSARDVDIYVESVGAVSLMVRDHDSFVSFFSSAVHAPRPTLFPYTTLFRSQRPQLVGDTMSDALDTILEAVSAMNPITKSWLIQDRKSTRLNSSHVSISYAVFCLKKKKK